MLDDEFCLITLYGVQNTEVKEGDSPEAIDGGDGERHERGQESHHQDGHAHHPDDLHLRRPLPEDQLVHVPAGRKHVRDLEHFEGT